MNEKIKLLKIIHFALLTSVTAAYFILGDVLNISIPNLEGNDLYFAFIPLIAYFASNFMFKKTINTIDEKTSDHQKFGIYQTASIIRWAILEGASFLILILKPKLLIFGLVILIYLYFVRPTEEHIKQTLNIK